MQGKARSQLIEKVGLRIGAMLGFEQMLFNEQT
jgi:hypothetical protein